MRVLTNKTRQSYIIFFNVQNFFLDKTPFYWCYLRFLLYNQMRFRQNCFHFITKNTIIITICKEKFFYYFFKTMNFAYIRVSTEQQSDVKSTI